MNAPKNKTGEAAGENVTRISNNRTIETKAREDTNHEAEKVITAFHAEGDVSVGGNLEINTKTYILPELKEGLRLPVVFGVDDPVDSFFGRQDILADLHRKLVENPSASSTVSSKTGRPTVLSRMKILCGLGGVGKTQTARKYILENQKCFTNIVWIKAQSHEMMTNTFVALHRKIQQLQRNNSNNKDGQSVDPKDDYLMPEIVQGVYEALCDKPTLVVFDNAEGYGDEDGIEGISYFLPRRLPNTHAPPFILVTTRSQTWGTPTSFHIIDLDVFSINESVGFLQKELGLNSRRDLDLDRTLSNEDLNHEIKKELEDLKELSELLGCLPLALQQAVSYIRQQMKQYRYADEDYTIAHYIQEFGHECGMWRNRQALLEHRPENPNPRNQTVSTIWKITMKRLEEHGSEGSMAVRIIKFLARSMVDGFPSKLLFTMYAKEGEKVVRQALVLLENYALIRLERGIPQGIGSVDYSDQLTEYEKTEGPKVSSRWKFISIHRLVQSAVAESLSHDEVTAFLNPGSSSKNNQATLPSNSSDTKTNADPPNNPNSDQDPDFAMNNSLDFMKAAMDFQNRTNDDSGVSRSGLPLGSDPFQVFNQAASLLQEVPMEEHERKIGSGIVSSMKNLLSVWGDFGESLANKLSMDNRKSWDPSSGVPLYNSILDPAPAETALAMQKLAKIFQPTKDDEVEDTTNMEPCSPSSQTDPNPGPSTNPDPDQNLNRVMNTAFDCFREIMAFRNPTGESKVLLDALSGVLQNGLPKGADPGHLVGEAIKIFQDIPVQPHERAQVDASLGFLSTVQRFFSTQEDVAANLKRLSSIDTSKYRDENRESSSKDSAPAETTPVMQKLAEFFNEMEERKRKIDLMKKLDDDVLE